jgi:C-terminal processing protease CtpA/Prc
MRFTTIALAAMALGTFSTAVEAQAKAKSKDKEESTTRTFYRSSSDENDRAALGVNTTASGRRDTLGLLIESVVADSPAEKAGLEEGNRIVSINGVSLQLSRADAGERDMDGVMTRRLIRELRKITPGQDAELKVYANGQTKTVKVKTTDVEELQELEHRASRRMNVDDDDRAVIGLNFGGGGSKRDTLGVFIVSITEDGPAAKAGIEEGNRIAAINGTDLRVSREDAGDGYMNNAKANRFRRIMRTIEPGQSVDLRIYGGGQFRNVKVTTVAASDLYRSNSRSWGVFGEGGNFVFPRVMTTPRPPLAPRPPLLPGRSRMTIENDDDFEYFGDDMRIAIESAVEAAKAGVQTIEPAFARARADLERAQAEVQRSLGGRGSVRVVPRTPRAAVLGEEEDDRCPASVSGDAVGQWREIATQPSMTKSMSASGYGATYTLEIPGLCVTKVNADLAAYFGDGAERGLLVLKAEPPFDDLRAGDVLLSVNDKLVRSGDNGKLEFKVDAKNRVEFLRKGERMATVVQVER